MDTVEDKLGYTPDVRNSAEERGHVNEISSKVRDWMALSGETSGGDAAVNTCHSVDDQREKYYLIRHVWSIYDVREGSYSDAMDNIRQRLPEDGWNVTKDEPTNSRARNPQIVAVHEKSKHTIVIEWAQRKNDPKNELIKVNVDSRCMQGTSGDDLGRS
ncbi:hypothetical protein MTQ01_06915 [Streptomyces sp. XM4193]|uniref:hypothetical protein n=1 Tax=Streptomyces sp. XM4193 TaxID=2929782 RepID=UPI001FFBECAE|nr:hypothetical protein [Streptomyces sp. XM4193]MCK1795745.1 hypothetical protein [Streptomyces sp. XM4193]